MADKNPDLVVVFRSQGQLAAQVARAKLEAVGIPAILSYDSGSTVLALTVDGLGEVRVLVPQEFAAEAQALLDESVDWHEEEDESSQET